MIYKNKLRPIARISPAFAVPVFLFAALFINTQLAAAAPVMLDTGGPPPPQPPPTATLTANGAGFIVVNVGDTVNFVWSSTDADTATSSFKVDSQDTCGRTGTGPFPWVANTLGPSSASGVAAQCQAGHLYTFTYKVSAVGVGSDSASVQVLVSDGSPAPAVYVSATPASFPAGGSATLSWSVLNSYKSCSATGSWSSSPTLPSGSQTITLPAGIYSYTIWCWNAGGVGSKTQQVVVFDPNPPVIGIRYSDNGANNQLGLPAFTPSGGGDSPGTGDSNLYEYDGGSVWLSSKGPFTTDFRVALRIGASAGGISCNPALMTGATNYSYGPWVYTPWATLGGGNSYWTSDNIGYDVDCGQIRLQQQSLPLNTYVSNIYFGLTQGDNAGGQSGQPPALCGSGPSGPIGSGYSYGPTWSSDANVGTGNVDCGMLSLGATFGTLPTPNPMPASAGTINVSSTNSVTGGPVNASWDFPTSAPYSNPSNPCSGSVTLCYGSQHTYTSQPVGTYTIVPGTAPAGYVLGPTKEKFFAERPKGLWDTLVSIANAFSFPPGNRQTQTLAAGGAANFVILWDPIAQLGVSPTAVPVSNTSPDGTITISNPGSDGSTLNWATSTPSYAGGPTGWLSLLYSGAPSVSVLNGVSQNQNITAHATTSSIPPGACRAASPCTATVTFTGTYPVTNSPPQPALTSNNLPSVLVTITLTMSGGPVAISITPAPPTVVAVGVPAQVSCSGGSGSYQWSSSGPATFSSNTSVSGQIINVSFSSQSSPTYTVTCTEIGGSGLSASTNVKVTAPCKISASPTSIIPPQQSTLTWGCSSGTAISCTINGSATINGTPVGTGGSTSVSPTQNSVYALSCIASNGLNTTMSSQTMVTVQGPGVIETNP